MVVNLGREMASWRSFLPLLVIISLVIYEEMVSIPTCVTLPHHSDYSPTPTDVTAMLVADLLLLGSEAGYMNLIFRHSYMTKFFRKSLEKLNPDMLVVLGDISANGWKSTNEQWFSILHQFQDMLGPSIGIPLYIVVGDRDVGGCSQMNRFVDCSANSLPGLGSTACGSFSVSNVNFVSLNAMAMACDRDDLRFSVERVIETESTEVQLRHQEEEEEEEETNTLEIQQERFKEEEAIGLGACEENAEATSEEEAAVPKEQFSWRQNTAPAGSGPVVLLHLPLHRTDDRDCTSIDIPKCSPWHKPSHNCQKSSVSSDLGNFKHEHYDRVFNVLSSNASEYLLNALKPRIVFTAHTHRFCDLTHYDGTREITVPPLTWDGRDDPGFVVATFGRNDAMMIQRCFLARESHVLMGYVFVLIFLLVIALIIMWGDTSSFSCQRRMLLT